MKLKNLKEKFKNKVQTSKTKRFVEEHKGDILGYSIIIGASALTGIALGKYINHVITRKCSVEIKLAQLELAAAAEKVVGPEKTGEIIKRAVVNRDIVDKHLAGMSYKSIDRMIDNALQEGTVKSITSKV